MSVVFSPAIEAFVEHELSSGAYASREELIVAAVELLKQHQADLARLRAEIAEGMEGEGIPAEQVFAELRSKYAQQ